MKTTLKTRFSKLVKKVTKANLRANKDDGEEDDEEFEEIERPSTSFDQRRSIVDMLPPMANISGSLDISISGFISSSSLVAVPTPRSIGAVASANPGFGSSPPVPRIVVTATSTSPLNTSANNRHSIYQYRHSQISLSPFEVPEGARSSLSLSPFSSDVRLSQISQASTSLGVGMNDPRDLDSIFRRVNQEFDSLREEIRMIRSLKERSDRAYEAEIRDLRIRMHDLEEEVAESRVERGLRRLTRGDEQSLVAWEGYGSPTSPMSPNDLSTFSLPYDPMRRCAVSAEKLLASAPMDMDDDTSVSIIDSPLRGRHMMHKADLSTIESCSFASSSASNCIPFPCVSRPSSPNAEAINHSDEHDQFSSFMDLNATFSAQEFSRLSFTEATTVLNKSKGSMTKRVSIVSLVRRKYQSGEDQRDRRAMSTPPVLPSQVGTISLDHSAVRGHKQQPRSGSDESDNSFLEELPEGYNMSFGTAEGEELELETPDQSGIVGADGEEINAQEEPFVYMPSERMLNINMLLHSPEDDEGSVIAVGEEDTIHTIGGVNPRYDLFPSTLNLPMRRTPTPTGGDCSRKILTPKSMSAAGFGKVPVFSKQKERERDASPAVMTRGKENMFAVDV